MERLFSVRMRAAAGGPHERGGTHISGAERLVPEGEVEATLAALLRRAQERGLAPDFIRFTVEAVAPEELHHVPALPITTVRTAGADEAERAARHLLSEAGAGEGALESAFAALRSGWNPAGRPLRGAALVDQRSGARLDPNPERGVRVSRLDYSAIGRTTAGQMLAEHGLSHFRVREALAIATKVLWAGVTAELCWSDEPDYTTGYVATRQQGYLRFPGFKPAGARGGRAFFIDPATLPSGGVTDLIFRLEEQCVLIEPPIHVRGSVDWSSWQ